jgi:hypothetical protein
MARGAIKGKRKKMKKVSRMEMVSRLMSEEGFSYKEAAESLEATLQDYDVNNLASALFVMGFISGEQAGVLKGTKFEVVS